jgi:hypothetical protein
VTVNLAISTFYILKRNFQNRVQKLNDATNPMAAEIKGATSQISKPTSVQS